MDTKIKNYIIVSFLVIITAIGASALLYYTTIFEKHNLMEKRFYDYVSIINDRCDEEEYNIRKSGAVNTVQQMITFINKLDAHYNVFAAIYDSEHNLLTGRHPDILVNRTVFFHPFDYPKIINAFMARPYGIITVDFTVEYNNGTIKIYATPLLFRRIFIEDDYLIVVMATPYIPDTIELPFYYNIIIYTLIFSFAILVGYVIFKITYHPNIHEVVHAADHLLPEINKSDENEIKNEVQQ